MSTTEKRTILVIDDSPEDITVLSEILKADYQVIGARGPEAGLRILHSGKLPDLILLDVVMPDVDGLDLCRQIKAESPTSDIPVIFVTSKDAIADEAAGFAAGGVDYLVKPVNLHLVKARVKTHIELKIARDNLEEQNKTLREVGRMREEVEHINRHDLKNPLMVILNIPGVLVRQSNITTEQQRWLKMIEDAGRKMLEMINRSIDMFKMENGTYDLHPTPVNALEVARQIVSANTETTTAKDVTIELFLRGKPAEAADTFVVSGEELLIYSMLANLVRNAVEASPPGGRVSLSFPSNKAGVIAIHNAGAIPERIRGRFFQKFSTADKRGGTGLGAYSAKLIARTLGGTIDFETSEETGTTITVTLPLR